MSPSLKLYIAMLAGMVSAVLGAVQGQPSGPAAMLRDVQRMEVASNVGRREVLESILREGGIAFETESFSIEARRNYPRTEGANLVVTIGEGDSDIVIGAHYDAVLLRDGTLSRGAVDNAASAIILTRLAATLGNERLRHRVRIVFFDMEEIGLLGSSRYLEIHAGDSIDAMINLDINAYGDTLFFGPSDETGNEILHRLLKETCVETGISCLEFPRFPATDHRSFQRAGIPNVSISILPAAETHQLWLSLNSDTSGVFAEGFVPRIFQTIHTGADTSDSVEPEAMDLAYRTVLTLVLRLQMENEN